MRTIRKKEFRRIGNIDQPAVAHLEKPDFIRAAEAIFHRTKKAVFGISLALEIEHSIDDMLEHTRTCKRAVLRDMTDDKSGDAIRLCYAKKFNGTFPHLGDTARRALDIRSKEGLNRIDDEEVGLDVFNVRFNLFEVGLTDDIERVGDRMQTVGTHANLARALLPRHIKTAPATPCDICRDAKCQT